MSFRSQLSFLQTVYPPFTNREVQYLTNVKNKHIAARLKTSNLYMIGARALTRFERVTANEAENIVSVTISVGGIEVDSGSIFINEIPSLPETFTVAWDDFNIQVGNRVPNSNLMNCHKSFTPDSLYWDKARGAHYLKGFDNHPKACNYDLLYIGIANNQDSYERLLAKGHQARMRILSEEPQRFPGAHLSDEVVLFLFEASPLHMQVLRPEDEWEDFTTQIQTSPIIADAEKAFISLLKPSYNTKLYPNYPKGADGLYGKGLNVYGYAINENIRFRTIFGEFKGYRSDSQFDDFKDYIFIEGDKVEVHISD